jgi:hypothetical protein
MPSLRRRRLLNLGYRRPTTVNVAVRTLLAPALEREIATRR